MSTQYKLRWYQQEATDAVFDYFGSGALGNPILVLPVGTGKSVVIAQLFRELLSQWPHMRVMMLTHVKELIAQNYEKLMSIWPQAPAGIYSAGLKQKNHRMQITYAGIGSVAKKPELFGKVDLIIIDECHLVNSKGAGQYASFIGSLKAINPNLRVIGLTATPFRLGQGMLTDDVWSDKEGKYVPSIFTDIAYNLGDVHNFNRLIDEGYLCPLIPKSTATQIDTTGLHVRGGEFVASEVEAVSNKDVITKAAIAETLAIASDRKHWLVFAAGVDHANNIAAELNHNGIPTVVVTGDMGTERDENIRKFKFGAVRALVNVGVLTTGFDFPGIDLIVMLRPTTSTVLWVQALGRGVRIHPDKKNCLVLDFAGNTKRLGPINDPVVPKRKGSSGGGIAPVKECPECGCMTHASARICHGVHPVHGGDCGHIFSVETKIMEYASVHDLVKTDRPVIKWFNVKDVIYSAHKKVGSVETMRVKYICDTGDDFSEWICLEHETPVRHKARKWWIERFDPAIDYGSSTTLSDRVGSISININADILPSARAMGLQPGQYPERVSTAVALSRHLRRPTQISVWTNKGKYPEITGYKFSGDNSQSLANS